jgi:hypothetical protein
MDVEATAEAFYKQKKRGKWREFKFHITMLVVEASSVFFGPPATSPFNY